MAGRIPRVDPSAEKVEHPFGDEVPSPGTLARAAAASVSYTPSDDIEPLDDPESHLGRLVQLLSSTDWREQFDTLDVVRSLAVFV